jgi:hypothetical protein
MFEAGEIITQNPRETRKISSQTNRII